MQTEPRIKGNVQALRLALAAITLLLGASSVLAQGQGPKQTKRLVKSVGRSAEAVIRAKSQIRATLDAYNAILGEGIEDRRKAYKSLVRAIDKSDKEVARVRSRATDMVAEANQYFADWGKSVGQIASEEVQARGQERLDQARQRFTDLQEKGHAAGDDYEVFMRALRDQVLYLGHDLNPAGVASVAEDSKKLNQQGKELFERIDETVLAYRSYTADLRPE